MAHINVLELEALLWGIKFQIQKFHVHDSRIFQIADSYICMSVVSKGRSSSKQLQRVLKQIAACLLAHGLYLIVAHVESTENPTDEKSRILAGKFSRAERIRQRQAIVLDDAALSEKTQTRYYNSLRKLLPTVEKAASLDELDPLVSQWVRRMWKTGEPLLTVADGLCALHFFQPVTKRRLPQAWKLYGVWRRLEIPSRAPPLTERIIRSIAAFEIAHDHWEMATCLLIALHCLLRTGECLKLKSSDLLLGNCEGLCTLQNTKTSVRHNAAEVISITDGITLEVCKTLLEIRKQQNSENIFLWTGTAAQFRKRFAWLMREFDLNHFNFRPYSLRRGGATHTFQQTMSMEQTLLRGRWESTRVAKIYISDGLSYLPKLKMTHLNETLLSQYYFLDPKHG